MVQHLKRLWKVCPHLKSSITSVSTLQESWYRAIAFNVNENSGALFQFFKYVTAKTTFTRATEDAAGGIGWICFPVCIFRYDFFCLQISFLM